MTRETGPKAGSQITAAKRDQPQNTSTLLIEVAPRLEAAEGFAAQALLGQMPPMVALEGIEGLCRWARRHVEAA
ncbi:MAG TPA: hypothetical protein VHU85_08480 [Acidimicrobiales bacterium]|nr:hypothetical protein [Acidimicrobiales bacterium]